MGNLLRNPNVGLLFVDFEGQQRLRIQGVARLQENDVPLAEHAETEYIEAQFVVLVEVTEVYKNCPRYVHRYSSYEPSEYVPREGVETLQPAWKASEELKDVLPGQPGGH